MDSSITILRGVPMICIMGTIFFLSHQDGNSLTLPDFWSADKIAHMVVYGLLAWSAIFFFPPSYRKKSPNVVAFITVVLCILYGLSDEYHQSFITMRHSSMADVVADGVGAILVAGAWLHSTQRPADQRVSSIG